MDELAAGRLEEQAREEAAAEAHRLRGILGTYSFAEGTALAGEAEDLLAAGTDAVGAAHLSPRLVAYAAILRSSL
ncbi:MAG: Hpt domain-containing protein [Actinomycetota bacterium]|nr:Hpt domain-containing protein [Actinomycetota bacterium]